MQKIEHPTTEPCYFIAHNGSDICHYGKLMTINCMGTGQPEVEEFIDMQGWVNRAAELGVTIDTSLFD